MKYDTNPGQKKVSYLIGRFMPYFRKYRWILVLDLICAAFTTVCELVLPLIVQMITDRGTNDPASLTVSFVLQVAGSI